MRRARRSHTRGKTGPGSPPASLNCSVATTGEVAQSWLSRSSSPGFGKIRNPQYRIAVADARNRRDGRSIEVIGRYHPKEDPSLIEIDSERAQYWLGVGAQPTEPVLALLKITGDWQKFKGLPGAEGTLKVKEPKPSKLDLFNAALAAADDAPTGEATTAEEEEGARQEGRRPSRRAPLAGEPAAEAAAAEPAAEAAETPAE